MKDFTKISILILLLIFSIYSWYFVIPVSLFGRPSSSCIIDEWTVVFNDYYSSCLAVLDIPSIYSFIIYTNGADELCFLTLSAPLNSFPLYFFSNSILFCFSSIHILLSNCTYFPLTPSIFQVCHSLWV